MIYILCFAHPVADKIGIRKFFKDYALYNEEYYEMYYEYLVHSEFNENNLERKKEYLYLSLKKVEFQSSEDLLVLKLLFPEIVYFKLDEQGNIPTFIDFNKNLYFKEEIIRGYIQKSMYNTIDNKYLPFPYE